jgi:hypothetical protein
MGGRAQPHEGLGPAKTMWKILFRNSKRIQTPIALDRPNYLYLLIKMGYAESGNLATYSEIRRLH